MTLCTTSSFLLPDGLNEFLNILQHILRSFQCSKVATFVMLLVPDQVAGCLDPGLWNWGDLFGEPRISEGFGDVVFQRNRLGGRTEELTIWVDGSRERLGKPIKRDAVEDIVQLERLVDPVEVLLTDPEENQKSVG